MGEETNLQRFIRFMLELGLDIGRFTLPVGVIIVITCSIKADWVLTLGKILCAVGCIAALPGLICAILGWIDWQRINSNKH